MEPQTQLKTAKTPSRTSVIRPIVAVAVVSAVFVYIVAVVLGRIPEQQKLGMADIAILILAIGALRSLERESD